MPGSELRRRFSAQREIRAQRVSGDAALVSESLKQQPLLSERRGVSWEGLGSQRKQGEWQFLMAETQLFERGSCLLGSTCQRPSFRNAGAARTEGRGPGRRRRGAQEHGKSSARAMALAGWVAIARAGLWLDDVSQGPPARAPSPI